MILSRLLLLSLLAAAPLQAADVNGKAEKLAGDDDKAIPTAVPTAQGDERGPVAVTRSPQAASSFNLPAFVVTGSGERKALARRDDMGTRLDTSGGIKTSPGEAGAGKIQLEAQAVRTGLEDLSFSSKPFLGKLRLAAGYAPGYGAEGYVGQDLQKAFWLLNGSALGSEGGPLRAPMRAKAQRGAGGLDARAGWRFDNGGSLALFGGGDHSQAQASLQDQGVFLSHDRALGGLEWQGPLAGLGTHLKAQGGQASAHLPGAELWEDQARLDLGLEKRLNGRSGSALLEGDVSVETLSQASASERQTQLLSRGALMSRFEAWPGSRLGIGLAADLVSGDQSSMLLGPRLRFEQRLGPLASLRAAFDTHLAVSRLQGAAFDQALRAPSPGLKPSRQTADATVTLAWQALPELGLELGGFASQADDHFLPSAVGPWPVYADQPVRGYRLVGLRMGQRWQSGPWWQSFEAVAQKPELPDLGSLVTLTPWWSAELAVGGSWGLAKGWVKAQAVGERHGALDGSLPMEAAVDLSALLSYAVQDDLDLFAEGRNLAGQRVETLAYAPDPAPYVGAGLEWRF